MKTTNRKIIGNCLVVHEGMQNVPELKAELNKVIEKLQEIHDNESRHLSDVGLSITFRVGDLQKLAKKCFEAHDIEKNRING